MTKKRKNKTKDHIHYVNNKQFSQAVVDYVNQVKQCQEEDKVIPQVPDYIGDCFLRIAEGLSHKPCFNRYTWREEMVMDAVENCLKAINNFNVETKTRTGLPNAFAYFTQITGYAFLRRIAKENKQQEVKMKIMEKSDVFDLFSYNEEDEGVQGPEAQYIEELKQMYYESDPNAADKNKKQEKKKDNRSSTNKKSNLTEFYEDN